MAARASAVLQDAFGRNDTYRQAQPSKPDVLVKKELLTMKILTRLQTAFNNWKVALVHVTRISKWTK